MTEAKANPVGRPTKYRPEYCEHVQVAMGEGYSLTAFAGLIDVSRATLNVWMEEYPEFLEAANRAKAKRVTCWETKAIKAGNGQLGNGANGMIAFALKNLGDGEWVDRQTVNQTIANPDGSPVDRRTVIILPDNGRD